ncbi:hydrogenobyrinic acid a,c-diamide synthase (glutamine-hydrolyzing) [Deltaproteobacteria bacterium]|nr:hydrogenobyrinic acid a,c-diamide synthase (glutamine-hydrolyzing) [Deltaproteobacteria bacterium]
MTGSIPRIIITALKGGSGKTIFSLGLTSAWREKGYRVAPFKKGPDFIDAGWLAFAADRPCHNLDPFLMPESEVIRSLIINSMGSDISLIEGSRGLFDGMDVEGCYSTAELAKLTGSPVVIIADVTMATRTIAALVMGCQKFDPDLNITSVILNRVAGSRQENLVRKSIEQYCGITVIGSVPKLKEDIFPERHMGLVPHLESDHSEKAVKWARSVVEKNIDLDAIFKVAQSAGAFPEDKNEYKKNSDDVIQLSESPRIGIIKDSSFWFYYPENMDHLKNLGAKLVEVNSMSDNCLPELDALYIGGGFPETRANTLAENKDFMKSLNRMIENGLPVYAECGGLIYLGEALHIEGDTYPMVGALPLEFVMEKKPQGHGYTILKTDRKNPYYNVGEVIKGHEFHYSRPVINSVEKINTVFSVQRGHGLDGKRDGLVKNNLLATYTHLHSGGNRLWSRRFFNTALDYKAFVKKNTKIHTK